MSRTNLPVAVLVFLILLLSAAVAVARPGVPVASGRDVVDEAHVEYARDHVLIRMTSTGHARSALAALTDHGELAATPATGLAGLDAVLDEIGVSRIAKVHGPFRDATLAASLGADRVFRLDVPPGGDIAQAVRRLSADPDVELAAPDRYAGLNLVPNDPAYPAHWGHDNTAQLPGYDWGGTWDHTLAPVGLPGFDADADLAWDLPSVFGSPSVIVAIIDTGVDQSHGDLLQVPGWDFGDNDGNPHDDSAVAGHGTCCAGIAAGIAGNGYAAAGVAGGCVIMPLKVADSSGGLLLSNAASAIYHAANNGARIISMSFSAAGIMSDPFMDPAIQYAASLGLVMVAATGNDNTPVIDYPANHPEVIAVGAASPCGERKRSSSNPAECDPGVLPDPNGYTCDGERWWGSNYGPPAQDGPDAVDLLAPTILPTTDVTGAAGYRPGDIEPYFNGTSCAAPYAAGVCALIVSANPSLGPLEVREALVHTCTDVVSVESMPGWDMHSGYGLVNAHLAVQAALMPAASFHATPTSGCQPLAVTFVDQSGGMVTGWHWDFGDGQTDLIPNPVHIYHQPGTYTVTLTVTGPGGSDTLVLPDLITVDPVAAPAFSATPTAGFWPLTVQFQDESTGSPTGWDWDFGDGEMDNAQSPAHTYQAPGFYSVGLNAHNGCGGDVLVREDYIAVCDTLEADFELSAAVGVDTLTVAFTNLSSGAPITSWWWDFGDGDTADVPDPVHFYGAAGRYTVTLIVQTPCEVDTLVVEEAVVLATSVGVEAVPRVFALEGNAPNPFNPATVISFTLDRAASTRLEVYDASGRRVDVLTDGMLGVGRHEVTWSPQRLPSGVYFARLTSGVRTATRRMALIR